MGRGGRSLRRLKGRARSDREEAFDQGNEFGFEAGLMAEPFADLVIGKTHGAKVVHGALSQEVEVSARHFGRAHRGGPLGLA